MTASALRAPGPAAAQLPPPHMVLGRAGGENFPVASRLLPPGVREDVMALYGWARLVDEIGDNYAGDRLAALDLVENQLTSTLAGTPPADLHPLIAAIAGAVEGRGLPVQPLLDLVQANRQDQVLERYGTFDELRGYCALSANPVGRMVLAVFGTSTPERVAWSDAICTGLQLVEHWQDVAEDAIVGRVYIPEHDMARFGVAPDQLVPPPADYTHRNRRGAPGGASAECRALLAFECGRARLLLEEGTPLVASLKGRLGLAVAGFVAGGHAALDALAELDFDIYADTARPAPKRFTSHFLHLMTGKARAGSHRGEPR